MLPKVCPSCEDCPLFDAFENDPRSRGLCGLFDKVTRGYHEQTQDCRNHLTEVVVTLWSHEVAIAHDGAIEPKTVEQWTFFMPEGDINHDAVLKQWEKYTDNFPKLYLYSWFVPGNLSLGFNC